MTDRSPDIFGEMRTECADETMELGSRLARSLNPGDVVLLSGELGAGKTVLAKGIAAGLGIDVALVNSPSFTLMNVYKGSLQMVHLDLYRIDDLEQAEQAGLLDSFASNGIVVIEWPERLGDFCSMMPHFRVEIVIVGPASRLIRISNNDRKG
ncbi:MAG: tRNA (adenosine(37)-N6)-threonylcarbamoyltransferase complex ATPase subunit type 1 TsaE [Candidatus Coatesbacteria bacterium]|nr:tRNA (adenosine(37)-N6)-threonylcarbamoyltransferase complex ATPase subunit type 1 TsaE [Candidatus Coatesbacteria bacterium]